MDFWTIPTGKTTAKWLVNNILRSDKIGLFMVVNILVYWVCVLLGVFRLFGLI